MNTKHAILTPEVAMSLAITGRYVDEQVIHGRALNEILAEGNQSPGQAIWFDKNLLRYYSAAVAQSLTTH